MRHLISLSNNSIPFIQTFFSRLLNTENASKKILPLLLVMFILHQPLQHLEAQNDSISWEDMMLNPAYNFFQIQEAFNKEWEGKPYQSGNGYKVFKRWEHRMKNTVDSNGHYNADLFRQEFYDFLNNSNQQKSQSSVSYSCSNPNVGGNWVLLGPTSSTNIGGVGRVNVIAFHPFNTDIIWAGAPAGGLWKSVDGGQSWTTNTDDLPHIGVSDIAIHPVNPDIMYIATGDRDHLDTRPFGVLKSIDGGNTWTNILPVTYTNLIHRVLINPNNPDIVLAATTNGTYRTVDGGANWGSPVASQYFRHMEFKPGDPNIIYATTYIESNSSASARFYHSDNGGASFSLVTLPTPSSGNALKRLAIAVTPANPNIVFLLGSYNHPQGTNDFNGIYKSSNSGLSFSQISTANNPSLGSQQFYDWTLITSPIDSNLIFAGGVGFYRSINGGVNWTNAGAAIHVDHHFSGYQPGTNILFVGTDGGVYKTANNGTNWTTLNNGLAITQYYRLGSSASNPYLILTGAQDNGTHRYNAGTFQSIMSGDGTECIIDHTNDNVFFACLQEGTIRRSTNAGVNFTTTLSEGITGEAAAWVAPYVMDPNNADIMYAGYMKVWKSTNKGAPGSWVSTPGIAGSSPLEQIAIAPSNTDVIYAVNNSQVWKTTNAGGNWTQVGSPGFPYDIVVSDLSPDTLWITASNKVYKSVNGGFAYTDITGNLPNLAVHTIIHQPNSHNGLYVGTEIGVYFKNDLMPAWEIFGDGLPNVRVDELEIFLPTGKIRAATFGRGLWESDLYCTEEPVCSNVQDKFPYTEGFESSFGFWQQQTNDDFDWTRQTGPTPTPGTGPSAAYAGNYYIFAEATGHTGDTAILNGPCMYLTHLDSPFVNFKYHMYGAGTGTLAVEGSNDKGIIWTNIWSLSGSQANEWLPAEVDLSTFAGDTLMLRFKAIIAGDEGDIAVDSIYVNQKLNNPSACQLGIPIPNLSCNTTNRFLIDVTSAPGDSLGTDVILSNVKIIIEHTSAADLDIKLISPGGTVVELSTDNGSTGDNYGDPFNVTCTQVTDFNMTAPLLITAGTAPFIGSFRPEGNLAAFNNDSNPIGIWQLEVCDDAVFDVGFLEYAELVFSKPEAPVLGTPLITQPSCALPSSTIVVVASSTDTMEYSIDNGLTYQLSNTFSGLDSGDYNIVVRLLNNPACTTVYSGNPILVQAIPNVPAISPPTVIQPSCSYTTGTIQVNASGTDTLLYSIDNGMTYQTSNIFPDLTPGDYNIKVKAQADSVCNCSTTSFTNVTAFNSFVSANCPSCIVEVDGFESFGPNAPITNLSYANTEITLSPNIVAFHGAWYLFPGCQATFSGSSMLAYSSNPAILNFSEPVFGVGGVFYDDGPIAAVDVITLKIITTQNDTVSVSETCGVTGDTGFMGFVSGDGIQQVIFTITNHAVELDNMVIVQSPFCQVPYAGNPVVIQPPAPPVVSAPVVTQPNCATPFGTIAVEASGNNTLEYSIDNGVNFQSSGTFSNLQPGDYNIVARYQIDTTCLTAYPGNPVAINPVPVPPTVTAPALTHPTCATTTGTIVVNGSSNGTLEYSIDNGANYQTSATFSSLTPGPYNIKIRLQSVPDCETAYTGNPVTINEVPSLPVVDMPAVTQPSCAETTGNIEINASGSGDLEYSSNNGASYQASPVYSLLPPGSYHLKVRLQSDITCVTTYANNPVVLNAPLPLPTINTVTVTHPADCILLEGTIAVNASGNGTLEYSVNNGNTFQTGSSFSNLPPAHYNIVVRLQEDPTCLTAYASNPVSINVPPIPLTDFRIKHSCTNGNTTQVINTYDSESPLSPFFKFNVCADGSANASSFELIFDNGNNTCTEDFGLRLLANSSNPDQYGTFGTATPANGFKFDYEHPEMIPLSNNSPFAEYQLELFDADYPTHVLEVISFRVYRTPVLMVHGLWSDDSAFHDMEDELDDNYYEKFLLYRVNYPSTHAAAFSANATRVPDGINKLINRVKANKVAAGKVDVVGHSMGGVLTRLYQQSTAYSQNIARIITLNTPHAGSQLGDLLFDLNYPASDNILWWLETFEMDPYGGAIQNLSVEGSVIRTDLNHNGNSQNINPLPSHAIVTLFNCPVPSGVFQKASMCGVLQSLVNLNDLYNSEQHDLIVPNTSQQGGLSTTTTYNGINHTSSTESNAVISRTLELLRQPVNSNMFSAAGFNPPVLTYETPNQVNGNGQIVASLNFTAPADSSSYTPGDVFNVTVAGSPEIVEIHVSITFAHDSIYFASQTGNTFSANFTADSSSGIRRMAAIGKTATGEILIDSLVFFVCPATIQLNNQVISTGAFSAGSTINSNGSIEDESQVIFKAGSSVTLQPAFFLEKGAELDVIIGPCGNANNLTEQQEEKKKSKPK